MGNGTGGADLLQLDARREYDALVDKEDASLDKALADFWRMYADIWADRTLLSGLEELPPSLKRTGVRYFPIEAFPDRQGVIVIIGVKDETMLALAFEPCEYGLSEALWRDAKTRALTRAESRAIDL